MGAQDWPPQLEAAQEQAVLDLASDYALAHGLVLRPVASSPSAPLSLTTGIHAPYSLYPSQLPRHLFQQALDLQPAYNELYARVTADDAFLERVVGGAVSKVDEFQGRLYELWKTVKAEGIKQVRPSLLSLFPSPPPARWLTQSSFSRSPSRSACSAPTTSSTRLKGPTRASTRSSRSSSTPSRARSAPSRPVLATCTGAFLLSLAHLERALSSCS